MVEIFKTNICDEHLAHTIVSELNLMYSDYLINIDLEDGDKVLRVESRGEIDVSGVIAFGNEKEVQIELIDD